jgi:hypothetical protein
MVELYLHSPIRVPSLMLNLLSTGRNLPSHYLFQLSSTFKQARAASFRFAFPVPHNHLLNITFQFMLNSSKDLFLYSWQLFCRSWNSVLRNSQFHRRHQNEPAIGPYPELISSSSQLHNMFLRSILIQIPNVQLNRQSDIFPSKFAPSLVCISFSSQVWYMFRQSCSYWQHHPSSFRISFKKRV